MSACEMGDLEERFLRPVAAQTGEAGLEEKIAATPVGMTGVH
jgi:hypothetical protein